MTAHTDSRTELDRAAEETLSIEIDRVPEITVPEQIPEFKTTLYRDTNIVLRARQLDHPHRGLCVTLYIRITDETEHLIPEQSSYWSDTEYTQAATTEQALPANLRSLYETAIETVETELDVDRVKPANAYGVCRRKFESAGKYGIVTLETRFR